MFSFLIFIFLAGSPSKAANILALLTTPFPSHNLWMKPYLNALTDNGHTMTVLTAFPEPNPGPNRHDILLEGVYEKAQEDFNFSDLVKDSPIKSLLSFFSFVQAMTVNNERALMANGTKTLLNSTETFDLIVMDFTYGECFLGFVEKFGNPPVIGLVPYGINLWGSKLMASPETPSYMPHVLLPFGDDMSFAERIVNCVVHWYSVVFYELFHLPTMDRIAATLFGESVSKSSELGKRVSLLMTNTHFSIDYPRAMTPNMIAVGGLHNRPAEALPEDIQKFLDGAESGAVYFSLGSNVRSDRMSSQRVKEIIEAFRTLPQRVMWKWESDELPALPPNVMVRKWFPQNDVLAHPNVRVFITHGGIFSLQEAVYHGVPLISVPVFGDQHNQAQKVVNRGIGVKLDLYYLTAKTLLDAVKKVLEEPSYLTNVQRLSLLFRDQPQPPLETAIYWTEFTLRNNGVRHLEATAVHLAWYQYVSLDVAVVLLTLIGAMYSVIAGVARRLLRVNFMWKKLKAE